MVGWLRMVKGMIGGRLTDASHEEGYEEPGAIAQQLVEMVGCGK
jgi:hypothetical protein